MRFGETFEAKPIKGLVEEARQGEVMDNEVRRQELATKIKWGLGLGVALIAAPFVFIASMYLLGTVVALIATAALGYAAIEFAPVVAMKIANRKLKAMKNEAEENPIETLENQAFARKQELDEAERYLAEWDGDNGSLKKDVSDYKRDYPDGDSSEMEQVLATSTRAYEDAKVLYLDAVTQLELFKQRIKEADRKWKIGIKMGRVKARLSAEGRNAAMQEILKTVALEAVQNKLNTSMSGLKLAMERRVAEAAAKGGQGARALPPAARAALPEARPEVIDVTPVRAGVSVPKKKEERR